MIGVGFATSIATTNLANAQTNVRIKLDSNCINACNNNLTANSITHNCVTNYSSECTSSNFTIGTGNSYYYAGYAITGCKTSNSYGEVFSIPYAMPGYWSADKCDNATIVARQKAHIQENCKKTTLYDQCIGSCSTATINIPTKADIQNYAREVIPTADATLNAMNGTNLAKKVIDNLNYQQVYDVNRVFE
jgi:hypothetical protein